MSKTGKLKLTLVDVYGERLQDRVDIDLRHRTLSHRKRASHVDARPLPAGGPAIEHPAFSLPNRPHVLTHYYRKDTVYV